MSRVRCLYCDAENDAVQTAGFCEACGKKLPPASLAHKRREPTLRDPAGVLPPEPERGAKQPVAGLVLTAAVLHLIGSGAVVVLGPLVVPREHLPADAIPRLILFSVAVLAVFGGLGWWATRQPLAAAMASLIAYVGLAGAEATSAGALGLLGLPVNLLVLALLVYAAAAARRARHTAASGGR
jgi:hypothetical protein